MTEAHLQDLELSAYLDGETEAAVRPRVEAHLAACPACRDALSFLRELHADLREVPVPEPGAGYWSEFADRVEERLGQAHAVHAARVSASPRGYERLTNWLLPGGRIGWARAAGALAVLTLITVLGLRGVGDLAWRGATKPRLAAEKPQPEPMARSQPKEVTPASPEDQALKSPVEPEQAAGKQPVSEPTRSTRQLQKDQTSQPAPASPEGLAMAYRAEKSKAETAAPEPPSKKQPAAKPSPTTEGFATAPPPAPEIAKAGPEAAGGSAPAGVRERDAGAAAAPERQGSPVLASGEPNDSSAIRDRISPYLKAVPTPPAGLAAKPNALLRDGPATLSSLDAKRRLSRQRPGAEATISSASPEFEGLVQSFIVAALEADTVQARQAYTSLSSSAEPGSGAALNSMRRWLDAMPRASRSAELERSDIRVRNSAAAIGAEPWLALDSLLWPRRDTPALQPATERLARELVEAAANDIRARDRARAWLQWLASRASDPTSRSRWDEILRRLP